jgi:hypothetical protein
MSAVLVDTLSAGGIPEERVILNLLEGAEEVDAFVDLEGALFMCELKDSQFSMGHAYPFGGRIGLYKPDIAAIVATRGVAPEVKEYFRRVEPAAQLLYIEELSELDETLASLVMQTRTRRATDILSQFEPLAAVEIPVSSLLGPRLGIQPQRRRRRTR